MGYRRSSATKSRLSEPRPLYFIQKGQASTATLEPLQCAMIWGQCVTAIETAPDYTLYSVELVRIMLALDMTIELKKTSPEHLHSYIQ